MMEVFDMMIPLMTIMGILFFLSFAFVCGMMIFMVVRAASAKKKNDREPKITVPAIVVSRRTDVYRRRNTVGGSTVYYATFQVESGDRFELNLTGREFGLLREGDRGRLTFRGKEFLEFTREG